MNPVIPILLKEKLKQKVRQVLSMIYLGQIVIFFYWIKNFQAHVKEIIIDINILIQI